MSVEPIVHPDGISLAFGTASQAATWQLATAGRRIATADNPMATRAMTSAAAATIEMERRGRASAASEVEGCSIPNIIPDPPECGLKREDSLPRNREGRGWRSRSGQVGGERGAKVPSSGEWLGYAKAA